MKMMAAWVDDELEARDKPSEYISNQEIFVLAIFGPGLLLFLFLALLYCMLLDKLIEEE